MNETTQCEGRNGGYSCQYELTGEPHKGMHYAYYISGRQAYIAQWIDHYSQVSRRKAPVPESRTRYAHSE